MRLNAWNGPYAKDNWYLHFRVQWYLIRAFLWEFKKFGKTKYPNRAKIEVTEWRLGPFEIMRYKHDTD